MFHRPKTESPTTPPAASASTLSDKSEKETPKTIHSPVISASGFSSGQVNPGSANTTIRKEGQSTMATYSSNSDDSRNDTAGAPAAARTDIPAAPAFHRPGVPAAARPASPYAPVYGGPTGFTPHTSLANDPALANGRKLVVGEGINLSGEIEACDHLIVEGKVEAALKGARVLDIAETGVFYGTVEIDEATIAGRFEGDLTVNGRLTIRATGSITGAIAYKELAVEAGATLDGKISPVRDRGEARKQTPDQARARNTIDPSIYKARKDDMNSSLRAPAFAQSGTELPFSSEKETAAAE